MSLHPSVSYRRIRLWLLAVELSGHLPQHRRPQLLPCARWRIRVAVDAECRRACWRLARPSCLPLRFLLRSHLPRPRLALGLGPRPELTPDRGGSEIAACCWAPAARAPLPSAPEGAGKGARLPPRPKEGRHEKAPRKGGLGGGRPIGRCGLDPGHEFASVDGPCCARVFIGGEGTQGRAWTAGLREACWIPARSVSGARGGGGAEVGAGYGRERCCQPQREGAMMASTVVSPGLCGMVEAGGVEPPFPPPRADSATLSGPWRSLPAPP